MVAKLNKTIITIATCLLLVPHLIDAMGAYVANNTPFWVRSHVVYTGLKPDDIEEIPPGDYGKDGSWMIDPVRRMEVHIAKDGNKNWQLLGAFDTSDVNEHANYAVTYRNGNFRVYQCPNGAKVGKSTYQSGEESARHRGWGDNEGPGTKMLEGVIKDLAK